MADNTMIERSSFAPLAWLEGKVDRPGSGTLIALMAVFAGCLASFFTDEIKQSFPFKIPGVSFPFPGEVSWISLFFWILVLAWFALFWVQQRVTIKTISFLQKQASAIAEKVVAVSGDVTTIGESTKSIGTATENIRLDLSAAKSSANELRKASQEALGKIESIDQAVKAVNDSATKLQKMVETLPLGPTMAEFGRLMAEAEDLLATNMPRKSDLDIVLMAELTRDLLSIAATLAEIYDGRSNVRYAANIMMYIAATDTPPYLPSGIQPLLRFWPKEQKDDLKALKGVLVLSTDFTSYAHAFRAKSHLVDNEVDAVAFAIPKEPFNTRTKKWKVLPGAPRTFIGEGITGSVRRLKTHLVEDIGRGNYWSDLELSPECAKDLEHYYSDGGRGQSARSCCTFPLLNSDGTVTSVMNIHCDNASWLNGTGERQSNFRMLALPIVSEIASVFELIQEEMNQ